MADPRHEWVKRVLGIDIGARPGLETGRAALSERLKQSIAAVQLLGAAPEVPALSTAIRDIAALLKSGDLTTAFGLIDVLETRLGEAAGKSRAGDAAEISQGRVEYAKLLLRWRNVQSAASQTMAAFGRAVLADPDVQADPRYDEVADLVNSFADIVPQFGAQLEDVLNDLDAQGAGAERPTLVAAARDIVARYMSMLEDAEELDELAPVARQDFGFDLTVAADLRGVLRDINASLVRL